MVNSNWKFSDLKNTCKWRAQTHGTEKSIHLSTIDWLIDYLAEPLRYLLPDPTSPLL
jgi:hypothetical protein